LDTPFCLLASVCVWERGKYQLKQCCTLQHVVFSVLDFFPKREFFVSPKLALPGQPNHQPSEMDHFHRMGGRDYVGLPHQRLWSANNPIKDSIEQLVPAFLWDQRQPYPPPPVLSV
jgi:hypothetical protein